MVGDVISFLLLRARPKINWQFIFGRILKEYFAVFAAYLALSEKIDNFPYFF